MNAVRAFAPGTVANLGPGLDILALALDGPGDTVRVAAPRIRDHDREFRTSRHPARSRAEPAGIAAARVLSPAPRRRASRSKS
jgi:homoserine kinase